MTVNFEPQPVRRPKRGPEPAILALLVIAAFVGVAILKPWQAATVTDASAPPTPPQGATLASAAPGATQPLPSTPADPSVPAPLPGGPAPGGPLFAAPLTWQAIGGLLLAHDEFGLTAVRLGPGSSGAAGPGLVGDWVRLHESVVAGVAAVPQSGQPILALGLTAPALRTPLDIQFWRVLGSGPPQRLTTRSIAVGVAADRLFLPPLEYGSATGWLPGTYQVDALVGASIERFGFTLPPADARRDLPRLPAISPPLSFDPTADFISEALSGRPRGPFTIDATGRAETWPGDMGLPLDEAGAWLASAALATGPVVAAGATLGTVGTQVARSWGDGPAVIGVGLPRGAHDVSASFIRLAPDSRLVSTSPLLGPLDPGTGPVGGPIEEFGRHRAFAAFVATNATVWAPGVYRVDARFTDADGIARTGSWHLDVAVTGADPGTTEVAPLLAAARRWSNMTPMWGVLAQAPFVPGTAQATFWALSPAVPMSRTVPGGARRPDAELIDCNAAARVDIRQKVFAVNLEAGVVPDAIRLVRAFTGTRGVVVPAAIAPTPSPNIWLVSAFGDAPATGGYWESGRYQLEVERAGRVGLLQVCLGLRGSDAAMFSIAATTLSDAAFHDLLGQPGARAWPLLRPGYTPAILGP